jgi:hypothetical protein
MAMQSALGRRELLILSQGFIAQLAAIKNITK